jgi:hypothetical protein
MYWRVLGVVALLCLLLVASLYAVRSESPSAVVSGTVAPSSSTPSATLPSPTASARVVTITGAVNWNHHPQAGARVEISELGAPWGCAGPTALATTTTSADGAFMVAVIGLSANTPVGAFVCAYGPFLDGGRPAVGTGSSLTAPIDLAREITGLSIHDGDRVNPGPLTITWDAVPEATGYCVAVWRISIGYQSGPYCLPGTPGERITTSRFTTPALDPDLYTVSVVALTDVIIGDRVARPLSFRVAFVR